MDGGSGGAATRGPYAMTVPVSSGRGLLALGGLVLGTTGLVLVAIDHVHRQHDERVVIPGLTIEDDEAGVVVTSVAQAGDTDLRRVAAGDRLLAIDGVDLPDTHAVSRSIARGGPHMTLTVLHNAGRVDVSIDRGDGRGVQQDLGN